MRIKPGYRPIYELTRGETVESIHYGAIAVVSVDGRLIAHYGDPECITFLRSSAKPFQVMPFLEHGGRSFYQLSEREIAVMCASHSGTDQHVAAVQGIQARAGFTEADLLCGVHIPGDEATAEALHDRREQPTPNRHNCSGKHTGMLAYVHMSGQMYPDVPYISPNHPIQHEILETFAQMCSMTPDDVALGVDGCSAPNFAVPLRNAALAYARLCEPEGAGIVLPERMLACKMIVAAMQSNAEMVAGPGKFDTCLMQATRPKLASKGGAEGYQGIGLLPGVLSPGSPAVGIAFKISDGDARGKIRSAVAIEVLRQLGALSADELLALADFGPDFSIFNWREILVGRGRPIFQLEYGS